MIRASLFLLLLPSMLMPPSMCICRLLPSQPPSGLPIPTAVGGLITLQDGHQKSCACDSCRAQTDETKRDQPAQPTRGPKTPDDHLPGCPVVCGAVLFEVVVPTDGLGFDLIACVALVTPLDETVTVFARSSAPAFSHPTPPLFISHCSLQI